MNAPKMTPRGLSKKAEQENSTTPKSSADTKVTGALKEFPKQVTFRTDQILFAKFHYYASLATRPVVRVMDDLLNQFIAAHPLTGNVNEEAVAENTAKKNKKRSSWSHGVSIHVREESHAHMKLYARETGTTIVAILNELIADYVNQEEARKHDNP